MVLLIGCDRTIVVSYWCFISLYLTRNFIPFGQSPGLYYNPLILANVLRQDTNNATYNTIRNGPDSACKQADVEQVIKLYSEYTASSGKKDTDKSLFWWLGPNAGRFSAL